MPLHEMFAMKVQSNWSAVNTLVHEIIYLFTVMFTVFVIGTV